MFSCFHFVLLYLMISLFHALMGVFTFDFAALPICCAHRHYLILDGIYRMHGQKYLGVEPPFVRLMS